MTTSPLANPTATRELLEEFGLATKHRLGQNFLIDNHVIERICELAELAGDERVLEVGPGCGTLTLALLQEAACVTSIEADPELEPVLDAHAADYANFRFIMGDALKVTPEQIEQVAGGKPTVFVANLPYNVAATIILQFFQTMPALKRAVVMVQKEVADRIAATPGNKTYGGAATFKRNDDAREAFAATPLDRILFETDCPYMAPEPIRGLECEPAMISITANALVNDRVDRTGEDPEAIARAAWENACKLFQK